VPEEQQLSSELQREEREETSTHGKGVGFAPGKEGASSHALAYNFDDFVQ
jgi:hypothetical protein